MNPVVTVVLSILGGGSFLGTVFVAFVNRRKVRAEAVKAGADAAAVVTQSAIEVVGTLRTELASARTELASARAEIAALRSHLTTVEGVLRKQGLSVPEFAWTPPRNGVG